MELEIWPNFLLATSETEVPVLLVNGRISDHSFRHYRLLQRVEDGQPPDTGIDSDDAVTETAVALAGDGRRVAGLAVDVSSEASVREAFESVESTLGAGSGSPAPAEPGPPSTTSSPRTRSAISRMALKRTSFSNTANASAGTRPRRRSATRTINAASCSIGPSIHPSMGRPS